MPARWPRQSWPGRPSSTRRSPPRPTDWPAERLGAVERNVLRIALYELDEGLVPRGRHRRGDPAGEAVRDRGGGEADQRDTRADRAGARGMSADEHLQRAEELLERLETRARELERLAGGRAGRRPRDRSARRSSRSSPSRSRSSSRAPSARRRPRDDPPRRAEGDRRAVPRGALVLAGPPRPGGLDALRARRDGRQADPARHLARDRRGGGRAARADPPGGGAVELVHNFSLVHDDLPALDGDEERRGKPSVWAAYGDGDGRARRRRAARGGLPARGLVRDVGRRARARRERRSG